MLTWVCVRLVCEGSLGPCTMYRIQKNSFYLFLPFPSSLFVHLFRSLLLIFACSTRTDTSSFFSRVVFLPVSSLLLCVFCPPTQHHSRAPDVPASRCPLSSLSPSLRAEMLSQSSRKKAEATSGQVITQKKEAVHKALGRQSTTNKEHAITHYYQQ